MMMTIYALFSSRSSVIVLILTSLLCLLSSPSFQVSGHNWIMSPHRAKQAGTSPPCIPRLSSQPHVQVIPGQEFNIEWR